MNTEQTWQAEYTGLENTLALAAGIGQRLRGGEIINLVSDLGGGKTTLVKGMVKGMGGDPDKVTSPSFTICNEYDTAGLKVYHFDFYRLSEAGLMKQELAEAVEDPAGVVVIEWPNIIEGVLPDKKLTIEIQAFDETRRRLKLSFPSELSYLVPWKR